VGDPGVALYGMIALCAPAPIRPRRRAEEKDPMAHPLFADRVKLAELCRRHRIRRLSLFGSVLKGTARPDSDVDLLVEFEPAAAPGLLGLAAIESELSQLLGGRRVDLRTVRALREPKTLARYESLWMMYCSAYWRARKVIDES
jgi:predicted nucleotidyltransferase